MSELKPFVLYHAGPSPNPWKVAMVLEELQLPYTLEKIEFADIKKEPFLSLNPNGRVPVLIDPNNDDIVLWESGAIVDYIIDVYDKDLTLSYPAPQKHQLRTWSHFQMSGQGPYFGQGTWFKYLHPEKLPSAIERFEKETLRVVGVVELHLQKEGTEYLVGDKVTYADIMFVPWFSLVPAIIPDFDASKYEKYQAWLERLTSRPAVKRILDQIAEMRAKEQQAKEQQ